MRMKTQKKLSLAAIFAASALLIAACGGSGAGLIPEGNAGPLRADFEAVASAAEEGHGNCESTRSALTRTQKDFSALPSSVSSQLRSKLSEGISHLESQALKLCLQPSLNGATTTATTASKTSSPLTSTTTTTTTTTTEEEEPASSSTTSSAGAPAPNGGAEAPNGGVEANPGGIQAEGEGNK
jgi:hypothetical protein